VDDCCVARRESPEQEWERRSLNGTNGCHTEATSVVCGSVSNATPLSSVPHPRTSTKRSLCFSLLRTLSSTEAKDVLILVLLDIKVMNHNLIVRAIRDQNGVLEGKT